MIQLIKELIGKNAKALAAYFVSLILGIASQFAVEIPAEVTVTAQAFIVACIVWLTRNRE